MKAGEDKEEGNTLLITEMEVLGKAFLITFLLDEKGRAVEVRPEERDPSTPLPGDIFIGRIDRVLKRPRALFILLPGGKKAYLPLKEMDKIHYTKKRSRSPLPKEGDEVMIEIHTAPVRSKDAAASPYLSLKSPHLVLDERGEGIGFSKKLKGEDREGILSALSPLPPLPAGLIVRTTAGEADQSLLKEEFDHLLKTYEDLIKRGGVESAPFLLRRHDPYFKEDCLHPEKKGIRRIVTDLPPVAEEVASDLSFLPKEARPDLTAYKDPYPLTKLYSLGKILTDLSKRVIYLRSGGFLVLDPTEAMYVIDVNSGSSTQGRKGKESFLSLNLEAADAAAGEIRLRNLSGMILIDFIGMKEEGDWEVLMDHLRSILKKDPVPTQLIDRTRLDIVEITREKRTATSIQVLTGKI